MNIFDNNLNKPIFLKEDSNITKDIDELKKIRNEFNKNQIDNDIKLLEIGLKGEKEIEFELKNSNIGMYILHDITLQYEDLKAQIDYCIITKAYTYFIECKNLIGDITINNQGEFKREYKLNNKLIKEAIYSPYTQAQRHKELYKKMWLNKHTSILDKTIFKNAVDNNIKILVVLANSKGLLKMNYAPSDIKKHVIRVDNLVRYLKEDINKLDKDYYSSNKHMKEMAESLLRLNVEYTPTITNKYNNNLLNKLLKFREYKVNKYNIKKDYVFTDDELNKILKYKPNNINNLSKILNDSKIKYHGKEIIEIINNNC